MLPTAAWYEQCLQLHRFWSIDDSVIKTKFSGLRSTVLANIPLDTVKLLVIEPGDGHTLKSNSQIRQTGQIQEFLDYNGSSGIQHVAFETKDIVQSIDALMRRGVEFLRVPPTYYEQLRLRLEVSDKKLNEALEDVSLIK